VKREHEVPQALEPLGIVPTMNPVEFLEAPHPGRPAYLIGAVSPEATRRERMRVQSFIAWRTEGVDVRTLELHYAVLLIGIERVEAPFGDQVRE
jgi:hypothetical protein